MSGHAAKPNVEVNLDERLEKSFGLLGFTDLSEIILWVECYKIEVIQHKCFKV